MSAGTRASAAFCNGSPGAEAEFPLMGAHPSGTRRSPIWLFIHAVAVFGFLYLPIVILIVYSFNGQSVGGFPPRNLTLSWYHTLLSDDALWSAVGNSMMVAVVAVTLALLF